MRPKLQGKVLFVFSDPGGAKPCLSLIDLDYISDVIVVSDRQYPFYKDFKSHVNIMNKDFEQFIDKNQPDLIFTGTSYTSDIELQFIKLALKKSIKCYSFVDHWTSIAKRFIDAEGNLVLPDRIWVIDERAKNISIDQGLDESKLLITGNPYHEWLKCWKPTKNKNEFLLDIGLKENSSKILLYAPDPLSNINGTKLYGFDELSATSALVELFRNNRAELRDWIFLVKTHPNQDRNKISEIINEQESFYLLPENIDSNTCIYFSDVVMGFFSSFLLEADIMNKPVLRYFDDDSQNDPIAELNLGIIINKDSFLSTILKIDIN
jgi:hypothetical protein